MTKLTTEQLEAIRARCDAATEGPWSATGSDDEYFIFAGNFEFLQHGYDGDFSKEDATFIAHSRTDVPALLSHVETQAAEIAEKDARIEELVNAAHQLLEGASGHYMNAEDRYCLEMSLRDGGEDG